MPVEKLDILMVCELPIWPLDQGYRVHGCNMARALAAQGVRVGIASMTPCTDADLPGDVRRMQIAWPEADTDQRRAFIARWGGPMRWLRERIAAHQGIDPDRLAAVRTLVEQHRPEVVIGLGQHAPLMLCGLDSDVMRIWYAADEPVYFHLSCLRRMTWGSGAMRELRHRARSIALYALVERLFLPQLDGAIGVSPTDSRLLERIGGARRTVTIRNGVDLDYFAPSDEPVQPHSLIFWGRMDFEPNVDAVCWFARKVWPRLKERQPDAMWRIVGKHPAEAVRQLAAIDGIEVTGPVDDIRLLARKTSVTILPMRCGGGIKNKLLEAAAMGLPIVASSRAVRGLDLSGGPAPMRICDAAGAWCETIERLWRDADEAANLRTAARQWVMRHHTWRHAAQQLLMFADVHQNDAIKIAAYDQTRAAKLPKNPAA